MKYLILIPVIAAIVSCKSKQVTVSTSAPAEQPKQTATSFDNILGAYTGTLGADKITLLISNIIKDSVLGRFIIGDKSSDIAGTVKMKDDSYDLTIVKPSQKNNTGAFNFMINKNAEEVKASSNPLNENTARNTDYILKRKVFTYDPGVGDFQASKKILATTDVENLMKNELEIMRNEIFARHGYCFTKNDMREYFENADWYVPNSKDIKKDLTATEIKNIMLIKRFEKYADEHGDDFGR